MTDKVNGAPVEGAWFERDVTWIKITPASVDFGTVDGDVEKALRQLTTRGTVLAAYANGADVDVCLGHAAGAFANAFGDAGTDAGPAADVGKDNADGTVTLADLIDGVVITAAVAYPKFTLA